MIGRPSDSGSEGVKVSFCDGLYPFAELWFALGGYWVEDGDNHCEYWSGNWCPEINLTLKVDI